MQDAFSRMEIILGSEGVDKLSKAKIEFILCLWRTGQLGRNMAIPTQQPYPTERENTRH